MIDAALKDLYLVRRGDTLTSIAARSGKSIQNLKRWNKLDNPHQLQEGQTLYLSEESAFGVSVLFLDALRYPIENLKYKLRFDGQTKAGSTSANGCVPSVVTKDAKSQFEVLIEDMQGQWVSLHKSVSDYGHKLVTLVSGVIMYPGETELHPKGAPAKPVSDKPATKAAGAAGQVPLPPKASGTPTKNNPAVKTKKTKGKQGQSIIQVSVDIPQGLLNLFANYKGGEISEIDWKQTADSLQCDPAVLKAIAKVESGGHAAFWRLNKADGANIPAILFERHYFSRQTAGKYDATHPDVSWPTAYQKKGLLGSKNKKMQDGKVEVGDIYGDYASAYLRLINAYRLDAEAALASCSWGKFQIMGQNHALCGATDLNKFAVAMCTSEADQIKLLAAFIQNKPRAWKDAHDKKLGKEISLWDAVKAKDWAAVAFNYNGPGYRTYSYDTKLKSAYEEYAKK